LRGSTGGSYSLSAIANTDRHNNKCLGFATPTPDHIIVLQQNFSFPHNPSQQRGKRHNLTHTRPQQ